MLISAPNTKVTSVVSFGTAKTGLATVGYELYNGDGTVFQARTTTGVSEIPTGTGSYKVEFAETVFTAAFDGYIVWDTGEATPIYSVEAVSIIDIGGVVWSTSNRNLTGGIVTSLGPVAAGGAVSILQGDDYKNADGRALQWTSSTWPNLTGASILMTAKMAGQTTFTKAGTVVTPTGTAEVQVELTNVDTAGLAAGLWNFNVVATLSDADKITLVLSTMTVSVNP